MPLDPQVRKLLGWAARSRTPGYDVLGAVSAREHYAKAALTLDIAPVGLAAVGDLDLDLPGRRLRAKNHASHAVNSTGGASSSRSSHTVPLPQANAASSAASSASAHQRRSSRGPASSNRTRSARASAAQAPPRVPAWTWL